MLLHNIGKKVLHILLLLDTIVILYISVYCIYNYTSGTDYTPTKYDTLELFGINHPNLIPANTGSDPNQQPPVKPDTPTPFNTRLAQEQLHYSTPNKLMQAIIDNKSLTDITSIIASGIDINATDNFGNTALSYAIFRNDNRLIKLLINHGAKTYIKNNSDLYPSTIAFANNYYTISSLITHPENYDNNGIKNREALIKDYRHIETPEETPGLIICFLILSSLGILRKMIPDYRPLPKILREFAYYYAIAYLILFFLYFFSIFYYLLPNQSPYLYLKANFTRDLYDCGKISLYLLGAIAANIFIRKSYIFKD